MFSPPRLVLARGLRAELSGIGCDVQDSVEQARVRKEQTTHPPPRGVFSTFQMLSGEVDVSSSQRK